MSEARKNKRAKRTILALRISSTMFIVLAIVSFIILASEAPDSTDTLGSFGIRLLALAGMLLFGWLGDELSELADELDRCRRRRLRQLRAEGVII